MFPDPTVIGNYSPAWLYSGIADIYKRWLPADDQQRTLRDGGYYSVIRALVSAESQFIPLVGAKALNITTHSHTPSCVFMLSVVFYHCAECQYFVILKSGLSVTVMSIILLSVFLQSIILLGVILLGDTAECHSAR
jgi:hypothetical protein